MDNADLPGKSLEFSVNGDDIPEARRETPITPPKPLRPWGKFVAWGLVGFVIALLLGATTAWLTQQPFNVAWGSSGAAYLEAGVQTALAPRGAQSSETLLGHFPYDEAPEDTLVSIVADGKIRLRQPAADEFMAMMSAAAADGAQIAPISGFRSIQDQQYLFFGIKAEQGQQLNERAEVSAPPGYSEHHTGYVVDVVDVTEPDTDLEVSFESTPAFQWLKQNAARFNFELSFPENNAQGVSYEPWHWRFVGDRDSLETFYKARLPLPKTGS